MHAINESSFLYRTVTFLEHGTIIIIIIIIIINIIIINVIVITRLLDTSIALKQTIAGAGLRMVFRGDHPAEC